MLGEVDRHVGGYSYHTHRLGLERRRAKAGFHRDRVPFPRALTTLKNIQIRSDGECEGKKELSFCSQLYLSSIFYDVMPK